MCNDLPYEVNDGEHTNSLGSASVRAPRDSSDARTATPRILWSMEAVREGRQ